MNLALRVVLFRSLNIFPFQFLYYFAHFFSISILFSSFNIFQFLHYFARVFSVCILYQSFKYISVSTSVLLLSCYACIKPVESSQVNKIYLASVKTAQTVCLQKCFVHFQTLALFCFPADKSPYRTRRHVR
jgi:hypothetical protein